MELKQKREFRRNKVRRTREGEVEPGTVTAEIEIGPNGLAVNGGEAVSIKDLRAAGVDLDAITAVIRGNLKKKEVDSDAPKW